MISFERSTRNERDVMREALEQYEAKQHRAKMAARNPQSRAAAEWREYQADAILQHLAQA